MNTFFSDLFKSNTSLSTENKNKLVSSLDGLITFDDLFAGENVAPADLAALLQKYGWCWVSIDADPTKNRRPHAVVVNDITPGNDPASVQIQYYDVADGVSHKINFTDFISWVKQGALTTGDLNKAIVRLIHPPGGNG